MPAYLTMGEIPYSIDAYQKSMRRRGLQGLGRCAAKAKAGRVKFDTKFVIIMGVTTRISEVINKDAKRWRADLIVIGTHGRRGFNRLFLGSVAEGVIRLAGTPSWPFTGGELVNFAGWAAVDLKGSVRWRFPLALRGDFPSPFLTGLHQRRRETKLGSRLRATMPDFVNGKHQYE